MKSATADAGVHPKRILVALIAGITVASIIWYRHGQATAEMRLEIFFWGFVGLGIAWLALLLLNLVYFAPRTMHEEISKEIEETKGQIQRDRRPMLALEFDPAADAVYIVSDLCQQVRLINQGQVTALAGVRVDAIRRLDAEPSEEEARTMKAAWGTPLPVKGSLTESLAAADPGNPAEFLIGKGFGSHFGEGFPALNVFHALGSRNEIDRAKHGLIPPSDDRIYHSFFLPGRSFVLDLLGHGTDAEPCRKKLRIEVEDSGQLTVKPC